MKLSKIVKIVAVLMLLLVISIIGVLSALDLNEFKPDIIEAVEEETGRTLTIDGELSFDFGLTPSIVVEKASLSNADWGTKPNMVSLDKFELQVALMPLLKNVLQIDKLILLSPDIYLETNAEGTANWALVEQESKQEDDERHDGGDVPLLFLQNVVIKDANIVYLDGVTGQKNVAEINEISAQSATADSPLNVLFDLAYNQVPITVKGEFGALNLLTSNSTFPLDLVMQIADAQATLQGQIKQPMDGKGIDLDVDVKAQTLDWLAAIANSQDVPTVTDVDLSAKLNEQDSSLNINMVYNQQAIKVMGKTGAIDALTANKPFPVDIDIAVAEFVAAIKGQVEQPLDAKGLDLSVSAQAGSLMGLSAIAGQELPDMTDIVLDAQLTEQISDIALELNYNQQAVSLKGQLGPISELAENKPFPVDIVAAIAEAKATITGQVYQPLDGKGVDLTASLKAATLAGLSAVVEAELPPVSAIDLAANINEQQSSLLLNFDYNNEPVNLDAKLGALDQLMADKAFPIDVALTAAKAKALIKGQLEKPLQGKGVAVDFNFNTESLAALSTIAETELPDIGAVDFGANLTDTPTGYSLAGMKLNAANTDLTGDVLADLSNEVPSIKAVFESQQIDITAFGGEPGVSEEETPKADKSDRLFSDDPLVLESLKAINADISIDAKLVKTSSLNLADTKLELKLKDGNLTVKPLSTIIAGGRLSGDVDLTNNGKLAAKLTVVGLQPNQIVDMSDKLSGAVTDVDIKLDGEGASIRQIMAGLDGYLTIKVGKGELKDSVLGTLGTDAVSMLNPFAGDSDKTLLECSVVNFNIVDGIATADQGIAVSTEQMNIIGDGTINLKDESLDIDIKPEPKEGLGLSAGKLASLVKIGGTLANPSPTTDMGGALTTGASVGAAVATGGLSLLAEGLLDRATADANPCDTALGNKPAATKESAE